MNTDSRGIRRGGCTDRTCPCPEYNGGEEKKRCLSCGHPPGKHHNVDNPAPSHCQPPPDLQQCQADWCTKKVWYDFGLRKAFSYCSPECRDRHLLPINVRQLQKDLENMRLKLLIVAAEDSPKIVRRQPSKTDESFRCSGTGHTSPSTATIQADAKKGKEVTIEKKAHKPSGFILSKKPCVTDKAETVGFTIVGVVKDTPVYSKLQHDQIRLLDVIKTANNTPCHRIFLPDMDLQERFEHSIYERDRVQLELDRRIALQPVSSLLAFAKKQSLKYTHVVVLMYSAKSEDGSYGLSFEQECKVKGTVKDSPGDLSRLKFGDQIVMYAVASHEEVSKGQLVNEKQVSSMKRDLQSAHQLKNNVILFVKRSDDVPF